MLECGPAMSLAGECSAASEITSKLENHAAADCASIFPPERFMRM